MPGPFSGPPRRWKVATAIFLRCTTTIAACPCVVIRCGPYCTTSIVGLRMGRRQRHGFSGGRFPISLKVCYRRSTRCPGPGNVVRPSRQVIEVTKCPGLGGCSPDLLELIEILAWLQAQHEATSTTNT